VPRSSGGALPEGLEVGDGGAGAGEDQQVGVPEFGGGRDVADGNASFALEWVEVVEIGDPREVDNGDIDGIDGRGRTRLAAFEGDGELVDERDSLDLGDDAEDGDTGGLLQILDRGSEEGFLTSETVDEEAADQAVIGLGHQFDRAEEVTAGGAGGALCDDEVVALAQRVECGGGVLPEAVPAAEEVGGNSSCPPTCH
jgi:hypothetical protein